MLMHGDLQVATAIDSLKMESPVKKLDFSVADKENKPFDSDITIVAEEVAVTEPLKPLVQEVKKEEKKPAVAPGIKEEEAGEPLLQENPQRFVLFPIKYHEVRDASDPRFLTRHRPLTWDDVTDMANVQEG
jgi:ribonucleoside-diphosphate reductase subunit M2